MTTEDKAPPAMWFHVQKLYEGMLKDSEVAHEGGDTTGPPVILYEGYISKLTTSLGIPVPYYGKVLDLLKRMGCITQERRGGGTSQSLWRLWKEPTLDVFMRAFEQEKLPTPSKGKQSEVEQRVSDLQKSIGGVDVPQAIAELQRQIDILKEKVNAS